MPRAHLVELININQSETSKIQLGIPLLAEIDAVRVILIQVRWQQVEAERGLPASLPAHQERGKAVAMLFVTPLPVRYHRQEPSTLSQGMRAASGRMRSLPSHTGKRVK
jgi:hypothetical protein